MRYCCRDDESRDEIDERGEIDKSDETVGQTDRWVPGQMDGWMDGWIDGRVDRLDSIK